MSALDEIHKIVESFPTQPPVSRFFVEGEEEALARKLGRAFWPTPERAYAVFLHAYAALFAIPPFVREALARQPDRFSREKLHHTVATTSGFILDAFGFDRRMNRPRDVIYSPAPVLRASHARRIDSTGGIVKERISDAAMVYFATHLMRAAETLAEVTSAECRVSRREPCSRHSSLVSRHFDYFRAFFREAGYSFPERRDEADGFCARVDAMLAGDEFTSLWQNVFHAARELDAPVSADSIQKFLLPNSARWFAGARINE